jgi:LacI family transcriptional regulator
MTRTPTLEDVAQRAGVSTATVSRCLNAPEKVVEATRKRVLEAVDALGYAPNFSAQALAAKRTRTIGAIIPTMENAIFAEGIQAFQETLQQKATRFSSPAQDTIRPSRPLPSAHLPRAVPRVFC